MAETESRHWWFRGRRAILSSTIGDMQLPPNARILEIGCGTGGNLDMLAEFGEVSALELDEAARHIARQKTGDRYLIQAGRCPDDIPFESGSFDLVCMFDVLEHIEQDDATLLAIKPLLKQGGRLLLTVPAYQWLYGAHDEFLHHIRRYNMLQLQSLFTGAGLKPLKLSYFNTLLFTLVAIARAKDQLLGSSSPTGTDVPPSFINELLRRIFGSERFLLRRINLPFGVSLLGVLENGDA